MKPFTDYSTLRAFCYMADGDFSYLWYGKPFTETVYYDPVTHARKWQCHSVTK